MTDEGVAEIEGAGVRVHRFDINYSSLCCLCVTTQHKLAFIKTYYKKHLDDEKSKVTTPFFNKKKKTISSSLCYQKVNKWVVGVKTTFYTLNALLIFSHSHNTSFKFSFLRKYKLMSLILICYILVYFFFYQLETWTD